MNLVLVESTDLTVLAEKKKEKNSAYFLEMRFCYSDQPSIFSLVIKFAPNLLC